MAKLLQRAIQTHPHQPLLSPSQAKEARCFWERGLTPGEPASLLRTGTALWAVASKSVTLPAAAESPLDGVQKQHSIYGRQCPEIQECPQNGN